jgi:hypothetical protein
VIEITDGIALWFFNRRMLSSILVVLVLLVGWVSALRRTGGHDLITPRPYNNRHSDATAARDERAALLAS